ncbi:hypothetical protein GCM10010420_32550 [Streptomyces glaucosporus]|uniref:Secreted protein n=1 Tax=Streptomyces glaucosporus TaxID=284044 RepID=A0ABN3IG66_9ACTN
MLRIVTPLTALPLVLLALAEPGRDAGEDEPPAHPGLVPDWHCTMVSGGRDDLYGGMYGDLYTVQVVHQAPRGDAADRSRRARPSGGSRPPGTGAVPAAVAGARHSAAVKAS